MLALKSDFNEVTIPTMSRLLQQELLVRCATFNERPILKGNAQARTKTFAALLIPMHAERPHIVNVPVAPGFVWNENAGAVLDDLDYYVWIPDYDLPSTLVVNLDKGRYEIPQPSGDLFTVLYNDQSNTFPVMPSRI